MGRMALRLAQPDRFRPGLGGATAQRLCLAAAVMIVVGLVADSPGRAAPVAQTRAQFTALGVGAVTVVEDFEGFDLSSVTPTPDPLVLANSTASVGIPGLGIRRGTTNNCPNASNCLLTIPVITETPVIFNAFRTGTTSWGADFSNESLTDLLLIVVTGVNDAASFFRFGSGFDFFGVHDSDGLESVAITNFGSDVGPGRRDFRTVNIDNLTTIEPIPSAPPAAVPAPAALPLLAAGLIGLGLAAARRSPRGREKPDGA